MLPLNFIIIFQLIFSSIFYIETESNSSKIIDTVNNILNYPGWRHIKDITSVTYLNENFDRSLIFSPNIYCSVNTRIRISTILLGCTYANDLKSIFYLLSQLRRLCEDYNSLGIYDQYAVNCALELWSLIPHVFFLVKLMQSAMIALDKLHTYPVLCIAQDNIILKTLFERFNYAHNNMSSINTFHLIGVFFNQVEINLDNDIRKFCTLSKNITLLSTNLDQEYKKEKSKDINLQFYSYISKNISDKIHSIISEKYYQLGFSDIDARNEPETKRPIEIDFFKKEKEMENSSESVNKPISTHFSKRDRRSRSKSVDKPGPSNFFNQENENNPELEDKSGFIDFFQQELKNDSKNKEISEAEPEEEEKKNIPFHIFL